MPARYSLCAWVQESRFSAMCRLLRTDMEKHYLLDAEGHYLAWRLPTQQADYGRILFERLSPVFRYGASISASVPATFAESAASPHDAQIHDYGFSLVQGTDKIETNMLASADWDGDGKSDWLISCRVLPENAPWSRTYYLVVKNPGTEGILQTRTLALYKCEAYACELHSGDSYIPEAPVAEVLPGKRTVTVPPARSGVQERSSSAKKSPRIR